MAAIAYSLPLGGPRGLRSRDDKPKHPHLRLVEQVDERRLFNFYLPIEAPSTPTRLHPIEQVGLGEPQRWELPATRVVRSRATIQARRKVMKRRRLLIGSVATLATFTALWFATGALAGSRNGSMQRLAGSVPSGSSYVYTAQPGDTLWSIATRLDPTGDPRPLVARLSAELDGEPVQVGTKLLLP